MKLKIALVAGLALLAVAASGDTFGPQAQPSSVLDTSGNVVNPGDNTNRAVRVNVVAGAAGGGAAQLQVRSGANAWTDVGFAGGDLTVPVSFAAAANTASGTITANGQTVVFATFGSSDSAGILITGTWVGTIAFEASPDGTNWGTYETFNPITTAETVQSSTTINGYFQPLNTDGLTQLRVRSTAWTSGTANILFSGTGGSDDMIRAAMKENGTAAPGYGVMCGGSDGTNLRYLRTAADGTVRVDPSGTTTQPVSGSVTVTQGTGTNLHAVIDTGSTTACTQATGTNLHTVLDSGTVTTITNPVTVAQATPANLTATVTQGPAAAASGAWMTKTTDGTNVGAVKAASTPAAAADPAQVVSFAGANSATKIGDGTNNAAVKAASTAAVATDPAMVVAVSPNNTIAATQSGNWTARVVGNAGGIMDSANNATAPANVLVVGAQLQSGASATAGTAGQTGNVVAGLDHVLYARPGGPVQWSCFVEAVTATTQCQAAPAAGLKAYVTSVTCSNKAATVQTVDVIYGTGAACVTSPTALTHKFQMGTVATTTSPFLVHASFPTPLQPAAANAICVRPSAATAFGCTLTGYTAP